MQAQTTTVERQPPSPKIYLPLLMYGEGEKAAKGCCETGSWAQQDWPPGLILEHDAPFINSETTSRKLMMNQPWELGQSSGQLISGPCNRTIVNLSRQNLRRQTRQVPQKLCPYRTLRISPHESQYTGPCNFGR